MLLRNLLIFLMFFSLTGCVIEGTPPPIEGPDAGVVEDDPDAAEGSLPPADTYFLTFTPESDPSNVPACPAAEEFRFAFTFDGTEFTSSHAVLEPLEVTEDFLRIHAVWVIEDRVFWLDFDVEIAENTSTIGNSTRGLSAAGIYQEILLSNIACRYHVTGEGRLGLPPPPPPPDGCFPGVNCPDAGV